MYWDHELTAGASYASPQAKKLFAASWNSALRRSGFASRLPLPAFRTFHLLRKYVISTSRYGVGQLQGTNRTPRGLHRVAKKIGGGWPVGTVFESRRPVGATWRGRPRAAIAHRILWLEGLEPEFNCGGELDTYARYIYVHGIGDELTLGRPASRGCIHVASSELIALFDRLPPRSGIWIGDAPRGVA